ncbi:hypothetical protein NP233_g4237 [Leucocoprinus birnbaumii]|uniref:Uncharacterized protein n=1 Tax=Leucocoprinus birnbaumii TaxID=56174 RepID=A0AAD5VYS4_9AGAR|nr:hypothetical protein NP233_g4237 [Leucocoprinus birnbaumii]
MCHCFKLSLPGYSVSRPNSSHGSFWDQTAAPPGSNNKYTCFILKFILKFILQFIFGYLFRYLSKFVFDFIFKPRYMACPMASLKLQYLNVMYSVDVDDSRVSRDTSIMPLSTGMHVTTPSTFAGLSTEESSPESSTRASGFTPVPLSTQNPPTSIHSDGSHGTGPIPSDTSLSLRPETLASKPVNIRVIIPLCVVGAVIFTTGVIFWWWKKSRKQEPNEVGWSTKTQCQPFCSEKSEAAIEQDTAQPPPARKSKGNRRAFTAPMSLASQTVNSGCDRTATQMDQEPQLESSLLLTLMQRFEALEAVIHNPTPGHATAPTRAAQSFINSGEAEIEDRPPDYVSQPDSSNDRSQDERLNEV